MKMDEIAKNMIPNANSAKKNPNAWCDICTEKYESFVVRDRQKHRSALINGRLRSFSFQSRLHHDVHEVIAGK